MDESGTQEIDSLRAEAKSMDIGVRSCWECNGAHEHLRHAGYPFWCFECGHYFFRGRDITDCSPLDGE